MSQRSEMALGCAGLLVIVALLGLTAWTAIFEAVVESHCMELGWTSGKIAAGMNGDGLAGYCVARQDQTDVVVPWKDAKRR